MRLDLQDYQRIALCRATVTDDVGKIRFHRIIRDIASKLKNVKVISGLDLVGHEKKLFADLMLHPRNDGFNEYFENLSKKIGELILCRSEKNHSV